MNPKHSKVREYIKLDEGIDQIVTRSFFEKPSAYMVEVEKSIKTDNSKLLADVISCLDVLKGTGTPELVITIKTDVNLLPSYITKKYVVKKEHYKKP